MILLVIFCRFCERAAIATSPHPPASWAVCSPVQNRYRESVTQGAQIHRQLPVTVRSPVKNRDRFCFKALMHPSCRIPAKAPLIAGSDSVLEALDPPINSDSPPERRCQNRVPVRYLLTGQGGHAKSAAAGHKFSSPSPIPCFIRFHAVSELAVGHEIAMNLSPPRGTRDFFPEELRYRNWLFGHFREVARLFAFEEYDAPVVESLDGKKVRIPGYVVQLEGNADAVTEFLLVPYFGACVHVPPPPPNQIIHVVYEQGVPYEHTYDAVWIEGTIKTQRTEGELAVTGYSMTADSVEVYQ